MESTRAGQRPWGAGWTFGHSVVDDYTRFAHSEPLSDEKGTTPSSYITQLRPGDNVLWLGVENVLDDSNPLRREGGEGWDQRPGTVALSSDSCPDAAERGICQLGWVVADILVTARNDRLANHPAAAMLLELVKLNMVTCRYRWWRRMLEKLLRLWLRSGSPTTRTWWIPGWR